MGICYSQVHIEEDQVATKAMKTKRKQIIEKRAKLWSDKNRLRSSPSPVEVDFSPVPEVNLMISMHN